MHITGIADNENTQEVLEIIKYFMGIAGVKISVADYESRFKNKDTWNYYCSALIQIGTEILLIKIKQAYMDEAIETLSFNTLIVNDVMQWEKISPVLYHENSSKKRNMTVILNSDIINLSKYTDEKKYRVLCYGFNSDSVITASSIGEPYSSSQFLCCVKNSIVSADGNFVEPQEFAMKLDKLDKTEYNPYNLLAAASLAVFHGIDLNRINDRIIPRQFENTNTGGINQVF